MIWTDTVKSFLLWRHKISSLTQPVPVESQHVLCLTPIPFTSPAHTRTCGCSILGSLLVGTSPLTAPRWTVHVLKWDGETPKQCMDWDILKERLKNGWAQTLLAVTTYLTPEIVLLQYCQASALPGSKTILVIDFILQYLLSSNAQTRICPMCNLSEDPAAWEKQIEHKVQLSTLTPRKKLHQRRAGFPPPWRGCKPGQPHRNCAGPMRCEHGVSPGSHPAMVLPPTLPAACISTPETKR